MYLTIALSPLVWLMNWLSYLNGSAHLTTKHSAFGGTETWEQIDFITKFQLQSIAGGHGTRDVGHDAL